MENVVPVALQHLRATDIIRMAGLAVASQGQHYYRVGAVRQAQRQGGRIAGVVSISHSMSNSPSVGTHATALAEEQKAEYSVEVEIQSASSWSSQCSCGLYAIPVSMSNGTDVFSQSSPLCVHAATLLYQWIARPLSFHTDTAPLTIAPVFPAINSQNQEQQAGKMVPEGARPAMSFLPPRTRNTGTTNHGPSPLSNAKDILTQLGLSELRSIAREYDITTNGLSKPQLAEAILEELHKPETVRRVASALEKPQRQLLAALTLAGGSMMDDDLRGLFERFKIGQASQLQNILLTLQNKGFLFRTSLNSSPQQRIGLSGALLDVGWYIPEEVRSALHVQTPVTRYNLDEHESDIGTVQIAEPDALPMALLLTARWIEQQQLSDDDLYEERIVRAATNRATGTPTGDGSIALAPPSNQPSQALLNRLQAVMPYPAPLLRFAIGLLRASDILYKDEAHNRLCVIPELSHLLLGPNRFDVLRDLFSFWLTHPSYEELFELTTHGLRLRNRATSQNQPLLRIGELEAENSEARQSLIALFAQTATGQWIQVNAFARFLYRIDPLFLQKRQSLFSSPHWWIEQEAEHPLHPLELTDWLKAELHYFVDMLTGPLHWWGICDLVLASDGRLLAFQLTPLARWLLTDTVDQPSSPSDNAASTPSAYSLSIVDKQTITATCSPTNWAAIEILERFTEASGIFNGRLRYLTTPRALANAMSKGYHPSALLALLDSDAIGADGTQLEACTQMRAQLERWIASYGRVRIYTGATLLETADAVVMRELAATTSLDAHVVQSIHPTLSLLDNAGAERIIDDLKRRGQTPLVHTEKH